MSATTITLSTKAGYPVTFLTSGNIKVEGWDAFISVDFSGKSYATGDKADSTPHITLTGVTVSAHYLPEVEVKLHVGDKVQIGNTTYELTSRKSRYFGNGDIKLTPVE